ncbi:MAG: metallophosphoesterase [Firmicutes bacterium]|nr:metallophosphoesterase [Bacillota bacterium]
MIIGCFTLAGAIEGVREETFLIMGDSRGRFFATNERMLRDLLTEAAGGEERPQTLFFLGDLSFWGSAGEYAAWCRIVTRFFPPDQIYPVMGNHDGRQETFGRFFPHLPWEMVPGYGRTVYTVDRGEIRFIILNSRGHRIDEVQRAWLARMLAPPRPRHAVVLLHEPFYPTGAHLGESLDRYPAERDLAWALLDAGGVEMVFVSHEHNYSRRTIPSQTRPGKVIHQICVGSAGAPLRRTLVPDQTIAVFPASYSYAILQNEEGRLRVTVYGPGRKVLDGFAGETVAHEEYENEREDG